MDRRRKRWGLGGGGGGDLTRTDGGFQMGVGRDTASEWEGQSRWSQWVPGAVTSREPCQLWMRLRPRRHCETPHFEGRSAAPDARPLHHPASRSCTTDGRGMSHVSDDRP
ncbi:unnamed protein product [Merluccius merluccius]